MQQRTNRRAFISKAAKTAALSAMTIPVLAAAPAVDKVFIHHVYFWLKNPESQDDKDKLIAGLKKLATAKNHKKRTHRYACCYQPRCD